MPTIALSEIKIWADNYNSGDIGALTISFRRFGFNGAVKIWKQNECRAGNHSVLALRMIKAEGPNPEYDLQWPPKHVEVDKAGEWFIPYVDIRHLDEQGAIGFAIADNRLARLASTNDVLLLKYLKSLGDITLIAAGYDANDVDDLNRFLHPPTIDELGETYGEPEPMDLWPIISLRVAPETFQLWQSLTKRMDGDNNAEKIHLILEAAHESLSGSM